jgi:hypothetical protein
MSRALRRFRIGDRSKSTQGYSPEMEERRGAGQAQVAALVIFRSLPVITVGQAMRPPTHRPVAFGFKILALVPNLVNLIFEAL